MTEADIKRLQAVGKEAQAARHEFILKDDQDAVWGYFKTLRNARVDIVLDNCELRTMMYSSIATSWSTGKLGLRWMINIFQPYTVTDAFDQLFTDLVFADFLVTYTSRVEKIVFQWVLKFVSLSCGWALKARRWYHGLYRMSHRLTSNRPSSRCLTQDFLILWP